MGSENVLGTFWNMYSACMHVHVRIYTPIYIFMATHIIGIHIRAINTLHVYIYLHIII